MSTPLTFYLADIDIDSSANGAKLSAGTELPVASDDGVVVEYDISYSIVASLFRFVTDSSDIDDISASDLSYCVADTSMNINFAGSVCATTGVAPMAPSATNNTIGDDYTRWIAHQIFGTINAVDLFNNEKAIKDSVHTNSGSNLNAKLATLNAMGFRTDDDPSNNPTKNIIDHIFFKDKQRFVDLSGQPQQLTSINGVSQYTYPVPFRNDDVIQFKVTIQDSNATNHRTSLGVTDMSGNTAVVGQYSPISDRIYILNLKIKDKP